MHDCELWLFYSHIEKEVLAKNLFSVELVEYSGRTFQFYSPYPRIILKDKPGIIGRRKDPGHRIEFIRAIGKIIEEEGAFTADFVGQHFMS